MQETITNSALISSTAGVLLVLATICALSFLVENKTKWKFFEYVPPLMFIYILPMILSNTGVIPNKSPVYSFMSSHMLPIFLTLMLLDVNVGKAVKIIGRGVVVMLFGTFGVVLGAPLAFALVQGKLNPEAWKGFGALAGSWIGGTGNMAAVAEGLGTLPADFGLAALADNMVYIIWLPILLGSKAFAKQFNKFTKVPQERVEQLKIQSGEISHDKGRMEMRHLLYLLTLGFAVTWMAQGFSEMLPVVKPVLSAGTWKILIITTLAIALSFTPAKKIPGSSPLAMGIIYLFVANMGARAEVSSLMGQAPWFLLGAYVWIILHGLFCIIGARIMKVGIHTTAIASAANIGGAASAPIVAACHDERLVPVSILMALIGYAVGNYAAFFTAQLCYWVTLL